MSSIDNEEFELEFHSHEEEGFVRLHQMTETEDEESYDQFYSPTAWGPLSTLDEMYNY